MLLHRIPDDGAPHAPTTECGCAPYWKVVAGDDGLVRSVMQHNEIRDCDLAGGDDSGWTEQRDAGES